MAMGNRHLREARPFGLIRQLQILSGSRRQVESLDPA